MTVVELFILALLGHLVGDYILQNNWMAKHKAEPNWYGWWACVVHATLYTTAVLALLGRFDIWLFVLAVPTAMFTAAHFKNDWHRYALLMFLMGALSYQSRHNLILTLVIGVPHFLIDRYSLASYLLRFKNGIKPFDILKSNEVNFSPAQVWQVAFTAPVYILNDNVIHLLMLWLTVKYLVA